jgi:chromosome partitioning protein
MNAKGGVGKTTISTNLASWFALNGVATTLMDYDPQGSSLSWLDARPTDSPKIHAADGAPAKGNGLKSFSRYIPRETQHLILDAPAGPSRLLMQQLLDRANAILIPVAPSRIDIHATANFIRELLLITCVRHQDVRLAVVANRARSSTSVYEPLERFVSSLGLNFLTYLFDSEVYIEAGDTGLGVFELHRDYAIDQQCEFMPIADWVDPDICKRRKGQSNVLQFPRARA